MKKIKIKLLNDDATIPIKSSGSVLTGYDICSSGNYFIEKKSRILVSTGILVEIPDYYHLHIAPRSELSICDVGNTIIVNNEEIKVLIINNSNVPHEIQIGDKIAQLIVTRRDLDILEITK